MTITNSVKSPPALLIRLRGAFSGQVELVALAPDVFRLRLARGAAQGRAGTDIPRSSWPAVACETRKDHDAASVSTSAAALRVRRADGAISLLRADTPVLRSIGGPRTVGGAIEVSFELSAGARVYGCGERTGRLNKRGRQLAFWATDQRPDTPRDDPLYQAIPFWLVADGPSTVGLFLDHGGRSRLDLGASRPDRWTASVRGAAFDLYVFAGPDARVILDRYSQLTGRPFLPPRWALGYHQSRWGYDSADEVLRVARELRQRRIPCDAIHLDIDYMDRHQVFTWDTARFPDPRGLVRELRAQGLRLVPIVDPGVGARARDRTYREGVRGSYFCRNSSGRPYIGRVWPGAAAFPDFERAATRRWWSRHLARALLDLGIEGIWNDMNEPSNLARSKTIPDAVLQGDPGHERRHRDVHNLYAIRMCAATYDALRQAHPDQRPFVLSRSGYAGIQRYAAVWLGDNSAWWDHLAASIPMALGMGLSGVPFVGADVGGFDDDVEPELFVRWMQVGALLPFFRNHCALKRRAQEPWAFGPEVEALVRDAIGLRYRLLPYLEQQFALAHETGMPIARPLWLDHPGDPATYELDDEFLFGPDLLVAPVLTPGARARAVYLPVGEWIDFHTRRAHRGESWILAEAPLGRIPLFVRGRAALRLLPSGRQSAEWTDDEVEVWQERATPPS